MTESRTQRNRRTSASSKLLPPSNREKIIFQLSRSDRSGFALVEVEVSKLDAAWRASGEGYISPDETGSVNGRIDRFAAWLIAHPGQPINASWVYLDPFDRVRFADGHHRFALLRDRGYRVVKIAVRKKQAAAFRELFSPKQPYRVSRRALAKGCCETPKF